ncbi:MAG TPA: alpha/beta hydrolase [Thermomicrobiales bacterium]|nr:alpha/beta hydrolase [Thermomicrobiales bacterium]
MAQPGAIPDRRTGAESGGTVIADNDLDQRLQEEQAALLAQHAPGTRSRRVRWSRGETQVLELGTGPPLLLVHGAWDNAFVWTPILPALAEHHRVLAVDLPGHGLADPFEYAGVDLLALARTFLRDILDALDLPTVDLVGCSMGGLFSVAFALDAPDRVARLALVGAPLGVTRAVPLPLRVLGLAVLLPRIGRPLGRRMLANPTREGTRQLMGQVAVAHPERLADAHLDADVACQRRNIDTHLSLMRGLAEPGGVRRQLLLGERWQALKVRTVFLCGERDAFVSPAVARAWTDIVARNTAIHIVRIPDAGHLLWFDEPERVVAELERFLEEAPRPADPPSGTPVH